MSSKSQSTGSTDNNQPTPTAHKSGMTRRDLLRRSAVGAATLAGVSTGAIRLDHGPVQNSQAIAPVAVAGGVGASMAAGWLLREGEIIGSDDPPEGLTGDAARRQAADTARARYSTNASSIVDYQTITDGMEHTAWEAAKNTAIEKLNEQLTQDEVEDAAVDAAAEYIVNAQKRFFRSWDESVQEWKNLFYMLQDHPDASVSDVFRESYDSSNYVIDAGGTTTITLVDGTEMEIEEMKMDEDDFNYDPNYWDPSLGTTDTTSEAVTCTYFDENFNYLSRNPWGEVHEEIESLYSQIQDEIVTYVDNIYGEVQAGDIDTEELLTSRDWANMTSEDESTPNAIADLQALNVGVDLEREAKIHLPDVDATLWGQLGASADAELQVGMVDPSQQDGSIYLTYDVSQGQGEWSAYEEGIDGGILTFTNQPFDETLYRVHTVSEETVELTADDFEADGSDEWTADLSDDLDDSITDVELIEYYATTEETQFETVRLTDEFEILSFTDSEGNEYDETTFERSEPHTDDNYITEEEWQEQQERHEELIEQYEDAQGSGISIPGVEDVLDGEANGLIGIAVVGMVLVSAILSALNPLS